MKLSGYNDFREYWLRETPINNKDLLWFKKKWFDNLNNYTFLPGFRRDREKKEVINYFYSEKNLYLLINRRIITNASGVDLYQIPLTDLLIKKISPYIVLSEDIFVSESDLNQVREEKVYILSADKNSPYVIIHQEDGLIFCRDRKKEEYVEQKTVLITYTLPLIKSK